MGVFFVVIIGFLCVFFVCFFQGCSENRTFSTTNKVATVESVKSMSRAEVEAMLQNIEKQKAPVPLISAMCYKVAMSPKRAEYICPVCGEKTLYIDDTAAQYVNRNLETARIEFSKLKKISKLELELDESSFCKKCHPEAKKPVLVLKVTYKDGSRHEFQKVTPSELTLLRFFFCESLTYPDSRNYEQPLKARLKLLRELLGLEKEIETKGKQ